MAPIILASDFLAFSRQYAVRIVTYVERAYPAILHLRSSGPRLRLLCFHCRMLWAIPVL